MVQTCFIPAFELVWCRSAFHLRLVETQQTGPNARGVLAAAAPFLRPRVGCYDRLSEVCEYRLRETRKAFVVGVVLDIFLGWLAFS